MQPPPTQPGPGPGRPAPRREITRRWFVAIIAVWVAVLLGSAWWGLAHPDVTDREQTTVANAQPYVDEAIARVGQAVTADGGVVAISGFESVGSCSVSVVRGGDRYQRTLDAIVPIGSELQTLERVASAQPPAYQPALRRGDAPRLTADAGYWVLLTGTVSAPGELRFVADTGDCRPLGALATPGPLSTESGWASAVLAPLGLVAESDTAARVSCVDGGALVTSQVRAAPYADDLARAFAGVPGRRDVVLSEPTVYAFVMADTQFTVRVRPDATIVTATLPCQ